MADIPPLRFGWDGEEWVTIPSFPAYSVSSLGRVRRDALVYGGCGSIRKPTGVLSQRSLPLGHLQVTLSMNNVPITRLVHRLVAEGFLPLPATGKNCVCHRDDDPANNVPSNLFWGSRGDNSEDMVRKGRQCKGERVAGSKLCAEIIEKIRHMAEVGVRQREIAEQFKISQSNVSLIVNKETWRHVK